MAQYDDDSLKFCTRFVSSDEQHDDTQQVFARPTIAVLQSYDSIDETAVTIFGNDACLFINRSDGRDLNEQVFEIAS